MKGFPETRRAH